MGALNFVATPNFEGTPNFALYLILVVHLTLRYT